jgi:DNA-binding MarR family transcriptional regulator
LARLFAIAYRSLIDGLHAELAARGWSDVRPAFGFVLLASRDGSTTVTALAELMGTTKQASSKLVDAMEEAGYVRRVSGDGDGRQRPVEMTPRGRRLLAAVEQIYDELEAGWAAKIGRKNLELLRGTLVDALADERDGRLPPPPASSKRPSGSRSEPRPRPRAESAGSGDARIETEGL